MPAPLKIGLVGGSGLGEALRVREQGTPLYVDTPFGRPSGPIVETAWHGVPVLALSRHGHGHVYNPTNVPYRANIYALKMLGCTHVLASGAVGSLREEYGPRDVVVPEQVIDKTSQRPGTFFDRSAVHVRVRRAVLPDPPRDPARRDRRRRRGAWRGDARPPRRLLRRDGGAVVQHAGRVADAPPVGRRPDRHDRDARGTAGARGGAAVRARRPRHRLRQLADQARRARARGQAGRRRCQRVRRDRDQGRRVGRRDGPAPFLAAAGKHELLSEIIGNLRAASENGIALLQAAVERIAADPAALDACPARSALELAVWSDKRKIPRDEIDRLQPLWGAYFARA